MPLFEVAAVVTEERCGLLNVFRVFDIREASEVGVALDSSEDVVGSLTFRQPPLEELQRITPALPPGPLRVCPTDLNELRWLVRGARSAPIWLLSSF